MGSQWSGDGDVATEYERYAGLDKPEARVPTDLELMEAMPGMTRKEDMMDYVIDGLDGQNLRLWAMVRNIAEYEQGTDKELYKIGCKNLGELVAQGVFAVARGQYERGRLEWRDGQ